MSYRLNSSTTFPLRVLLGGVSLQLTFFLESIFSAWKTCPPHLGQVSLSRPGMAVGSDDRCGRSKVPSLSLKKKTQRQVQEMVGSRQKFSKFSEIPSCPNKYNSITVSLTDFSNIFPLEFDSLLTRRCRGQIP